jgi:hypothetical protein
MSQRVIFCSKVNLLRVAVAKASLNRANELQEVDPKGDELGMARLKHP